MRAFAAVILLCACANVAKAEVIAYWDFNGVTGTTFQADAGQPAATLTVNPSWGADFTVQAGAGTAVNSIPPATPGDAIRFSRPMSHQLEGFVTSFSMAGLVDPVLSFAARRTVNGFGSTDVRYSTDGVNYQTFSSMANVAGTTYSTLTLDLSSVDVLDDSPTAYLQVRVSAGNSNGVGHYAEIDNLQINATAVPEPSSVALLSLLAVGSVIAARRKRMQSAP